MDEWSFDLAYMLTLLLNYFSFTLICDGPIVRQRKLYWFGGGGGHSQYILVGVCRKHIQKAGS